MKRSTILTWALVLTLLLLGGCADNPTGVTEPATEGVSPSAAVLPGTPTTADARFIKIEVVFEEYSSAEPYDKFRVENLSSEGIKISSLMLSLRTASAKLLFDVVPLGYGIGEGSWMYAPTGWDVGLMAWHGINDGSKNMGLVFGLFDTGEVFKYYMDVDKQLGIVSYVEDVTGPEMVGATMAFFMTGDGITPQLVTGTFGPHGPTTAVLWVNKAL